MRIHGRHYRTIWTEGNTVAVIDQTRLPHAFTTCTLTSLDEACHAIKGMVVRGAPLIGVTAAYGVWLAMIGMCLIWQCPARRAMQLERSWI